ncbi:MAG TPA: LysM peptidoglycan-binding domain-containing protein [Hymenobacter sp.]|uniref:LysM peptidoglycan-binding domain-containing protein n=1 Tax=Hymenobacter sp. TaxID=1898978 RepID=UPI002D7E918F|nr:LysM peptidoglycan-binding domain-containing protein [Hymenobacter sp.]HET9503837.1 LysM peptidoglycan-binding domain-containing protein [Hymenobacter sp.]
MKKIFPALLLGLASRSALAVAPPTVPATIDVMGLRLTLDYEARQLVQAKVNSLCRHQASLEARIALAESAFPLVDKVLAEEGVPADFRYLVLQESALNGNAESKHGAVGYWQFKRETALDYGLVVDRQVDERRHLTASTRAAARYLTRSNGSLHNWVNTLLSYNLGISGVQPYTRPSDADASRMSITAGSSIYILDFIAQKVVFEPACAQHTVPFTPWREVPATPGLSLSQQAAAFSVDPTAVARLNPWLLASKVPTNGRTYTLLVPLGGTATPPPLLATSSSAPRRGQRPAAAPTVAVATSYLTINGLRALIAQPGDTPASLAARGGASEGFFMKVNELSRNELLIPGSPYFFERKRDAAEQEYHIVRPGQSLTAIAQHFGVLRHALMAYNHLHVGEAVQPGLVLWMAHVRPRNVAAEYRALPGSRPAPVVVAQRPVAPAPEPAEIEETAEAEQAEEIAAINELPTEVPGAPVLSLPNAPARPVAVATPAVVVPAPRPVVRPARPVALPTAVPVAVNTPAPARPVAASGTAYTVAPRETLYGVARRLGVRPAELAAWNNLSPTAALQVGQVLRVGSGSSTPPVAQAQADTYYAHTVAVGDTFFNISRRYGCSVAELQASNGRAEPSLRVGEVLRVPIH